MMLDIEVWEVSDFTVIKLLEGVTFPCEDSMMLVPEIYQTFWDHVVGDDVDWQSHQGSQRFNLARQSWKTIF